MELSLQTRAIICPKCQHQRTAGDEGPEWQCPSCGIAYNKATPSPAVVHQVNSSRDELATATPGAIALSIDGRIGRLRYLAFSWPIAVLGGVSGALTAIIGHQLKALGVMLLILTAVLTLWMSLRLMALRMHDLNRSAKWLPPLLLLPGMGFAVGGPQIGLMCSGAFWFVALALIVAPGSEDDNDYGPPPGANTTWVTVGAGLILALMALGVYANIKYMRYIHSGKLNAGLAKQQGATGVQSGSDNLQDATAAEKKPETVRLRDFVGTWQGQNMSLRVDKSGDSDFRHLDGNRLIRAYGPLRLLDGNHISIGFGPTPLVLNDAVPPHVEAEVARMTLDGVELVRNK